MHFFRLLDFQTEHDGLHGCSWDASPKSHDKNRGQNLMIDSILLIDTFFVACSGVFGVDSTVGLQE